MRENYVLCNEDCIKSSDIVNFIKLVLCIKHTFYRVIVIYKDCFLHTDYLVDDSL